MPVALFLSPHLDDAAFSCAEPILTLSRQGWDVVVATVFTASVQRPRGFALACQLDKGLDAGVDYMALRRAEDRHCMALLGARWQHLELREAPHRGYASAAELFGPVREQDSAKHDVCTALHELLQSCQPTHCFAPLGIGNHVDHRVVIDCLSTVASDGLPILHFADQPYALKNPDEHAAAVASLANATALQFPGTLDTRRRAIAAIDAYTTQVPFQFGSRVSMHRTLDAAMKQGTTFWLQGQPCDALNSAAHSSRERQHRVTEPCPD